MSHPGPVPRPTVLALLVGAALVLAGASGCGPDPTGPGPSGDLPFTIIEAGGIDGRANTLHVSPDGVAVWMSARPAAGQVRRETLDRVHDLLGSDDLRREAATAGRQDVPVCPDNLSITLTVGDLTMTATGSCRGVTWAPSPVFDEIVRLMAPALDGRFDGPVGSDAPSLVPVRLEGRPLGAAEDSVFTVDAEGRLRRATPGHPAEERSLAVGDRDVLRLLLERLRTGRLEPCPAPDRYRITIGGRSEMTASDCAFVDRQAEVRAVAAVVENPFR